MKNCFQIVLFMMLFVSMVFAGITDSAEWFLIFLGLLLLNWIWLIAADEKRGSKF